MEMNGLHQRGRRYIKSFMSENMNLLELSLPPEIEEGNVEYKLKLIDPSHDRIDHLVTQLNWRLAEGQGEAMYEIGVSDNGEFTGLTESEMDATVKTIKRMANIIGADVSVNKTIQVDNEKTVVELQLKRTAREEHFSEIRVAILGGYDAGKSTLLGIFTHGELDNGRGKSRLNLLRHPHEIESGRTSSISYQIIGFNSKFELINFATTNISTWEQICESSTKIVTFVDTCGHPKYQKTTILGLTGQSPDYSCLIVPANSAGVPEISREHLGLAVVLKIPVFVIITKIDIATPEQITKTVTALLTLLKSPGIRRTAVIIQNENDVTEASSFYSSKVMPIFLISNVTGENFNLLSKFFGLLTKPVRDDTQSIDEEVEYQIKEIYSVPDVGCVVGGTLLSGQINLHSLGPCIFYIGPHRGRFMPIQIASMHRQRCPVHLIKAGQTASMALSFVNTWVGSAVVDPSSFISKDGSLYNNPPSNFKLRRGQVILGPFSFPNSSYSKSLSPTRAGPRLSMSPSSNIPAHILDESSYSSSDDEQEQIRIRAAVVEFDVELQVLFHPSVLSVGCQGTVYCGSVRQQVEIIKITRIDALAHRKSPSVSSPLKASEDVLKSSEKGHVRMRFKAEPEHIKVGWTVLFREGKVKCVGKVTEIVKRCAPDV